MYHISYLSILDATIKWYKQSCSHIYTSNSLDLIIRALETRKLEFEEKLKKAA